MSATSYSEKAHKYFGWERPEMVRFVPAATHILEVGCGRGGFAATLKAQRQLHITAIEPFEAAVAEAKQHVDWLIHADVERGMAQLLDGSFDCIIFNDVLEHLVDPWAVLTDARRLLRPSGAVVASIPNMRHMPVLKDLVLKGEWRYRDEGVMDRTHLRFFTKVSIRELFTVSGYTVQQIEGINAIKFPWKFRLLNRLALNALDDARYMQFAVVAHIDQYRRSERAS